MTSFVSCPTPSAPNTAAWKRVAMLKQGQIVALDTTENLLARFHAKRLHVTLEGEELPAALCALVVSQDKNRFVLNLSDYFALEPVTQELRKAGANVLEMELVQPDLEEVFVTIMRNQ